jgi:cyanophycinase
VLADQHLQERDRIGRTVALLSRLQKDGWSSAPKAIAADRETSLHVDPADGSAQVFATADHPTPYVYFMSANQAPERCEPGQPLTSGVVDIYRIAPGEGRFDLETWTGSGGVSYELRVQAGMLLSSRDGNY